MDSVETSSTASAPAESKRQSIADLDRNGPMEVFEGYFAYEGVRIAISFQAPVRASAAQKDSAFLAALSRHATIDYLPIGECDHPLCESGVDTRVDGL